MIEIHTTNYDAPIYCTACGTQTTDAKGSVVECPHLAYLGHDEGVEFSIYDDVEEPEDDDEWIQYDSQLNEFRKTLDDKHLCVHVDIPAPSFASYCIIYNLNADIIDTKNKQNSDECKISKDENEECPHWTVWGPTLEKYGIVRDKESQE
jgi:hypothetical protein